MRRILFFILFICCSFSYAQQPQKNTAFKGGESLQYNLYFNWQFIWVKVGTANMSVKETTYKGKQAYTTSLTTKGNGKADKFFVLRDTLLCHTTRDLIPLYYRKGALEGKRYYVDELFYTYNNGKCNVTTKALHADGSQTVANLTSSQNIYDMLSIFLRARNYSAAGWKPGHIVKFNIADGNGMKTAWLKYQGKSNVKADNGKKYNCLKLSYIEPEGKKEKEIVRFFVTDDNRHVPVRLDLFLKFGSAKAFLVSNL